MVLYKKIFFLFLSFLPKGSHVVITGKHWRKLSMGWSWWNNLYYLMCFSNNNYRVTKSLSFWKRLFLLWTSSLGVMLRHESNKNTQSQHTRIMYKGWNASYCTRSACSALGFTYCSLFWSYNDKHWLLLAKVVGHHCTNAHWQMHNAICSLKIFSIKFIIWQVMVSASPFVGNLLSKLFRFRNRAQMPNFISGAIRKGDADI